MHHADCLVWSDQVRCSVSAHRRSKGRIGEVLHFSILMLGMALSNGRGTARTLEQLKQAGIVE